MRKEMEKAKEIFGRYGQEFDSTLVMDNEDFFIMDWRDKNGSGNLATRYMVDKNKGNLIITGDCIASWYNRTEPEDIARYVRDPRYFMEKFQCTTNKYTYRWEDVKADMEEIRKEMLSYITDSENGIDDNYGNPITEERCNKDFDRMLEILDQMPAFHEDTPYPEEFEEIMSNYDPDWWEAVPYGRRIDNRIFLWSYGFQEGIKRLKDRDEI